MGIGDLQSTLVAGATSLLGDSGICDKTDFGQMCAQVIGDHGAFGARARSGAMGHAKLCCSIVFSGTKRIVERCTSGTERVFLATFSRKTRE
ncbi:MULTISPECIES: hypothetical protein [unclassified Mesorhizobium]|uniref:hypothetical protein n=1 Tax=unclassified Mesorhizobium TaxID=325217 RepID=UPI00333DE4FE